MANIVYFPQIQMANTSGDLLSSARPAFTSPLTSAQGLGPLGPLIWGWVKTLVHSEPQVIAGIFGCE